MNKSERIALRLEPQLKDEIDKLVKAGKYRNLSDAIRRAIQKLLKGEHHGND